MLFRSNVKIVTLYAALKYLPDSIPSFDYYDTPDTLFILPQGDPSLFDPYFHNQNTFNFLKNQHKPIVILPVKWETEIFGKGWAWDDYNSASMPQKTPMPLHRKNNKNSISGQQIRIPSLQEVYDSIAQTLSDSVNVKVIASKSQRSFIQKRQTWYAASRDSVCKKMMFESDNFIAEQLLLMTSNKIGRAHV